MHGQDLYIEGKILILIQPLQVSQSSISLGLNVGGVAVLIQESSGLSLHQKSLRLIVGLA